MAKEWRGEERRKMVNQEERDILIRVDQNVVNLTESLKNHVKQDENSFKEQGNDINWLKKIVYLGIGVLVAINVILKFIK